MPHGKSLPSVWKIFIDSGNFGRVATCCRVSPCGQELVRGDTRVFRYEIIETCVFTVLLLCGSHFFAFSARKSLLTHTVPWCKEGILLGLRAHSPLFCGVAKSLDPLTYSSRSRSRHIWQQF